MVDKRNTKILDNKTSSQQMLLEEYRALHQHYMDLRSEGVTRVNFFITAASVALGGILVMGSAATMPILYFKLILLCALLMLTAIGMEIYNFLILRDIASDRDSRGMARIRNYFAKLDPDLGDYFINTIHDEPTYFLIDKSSGTRRVAQIIEAFFLGLDAVILSALFPLQLEIYVAIGICVTLAAYIILEYGAKRKLQDAFAFAEEDVKFRNDVEST